MLIEHLPQESWTQTSLRDADDSPFVFVDPKQPQKFGPWTTTDFLLARLIDAVARVEFVLARVNGNESYAEPKPTPRPGVDRIVAQKQPEAAVLYLDNLRARG
ncbi:MAG: hypothetical protein JWO67_4184 [Streptosporangiaceae bacterium]|nr:hypothetical protein [Streptosporangiaceae bacterium]